MSSYRCFHCKKIVEADEKHSHSLGSAEAILHAAMENIADRAPVRDMDGKKSMDKTVEIFNTLTDRDLSVREGWRFMAIVKMVRGYGGGFHVDDEIDEASYVALCGEEHAKEANPSRKGPREVRDAQSSEGKVGEDLREIHGNGWLELGTPYFDPEDHQLDMSRLQREKTTKEGK